MTKFKKLKGVTKEIRRIIFYDLEMLYPKKPTISQRYHYNLLRNNLIDLLGYPKED